MSSEISINSYFSDSDSSDLIVIRSNKDNLNSDFVFKIDKNIFVQTTIISYDRENLKNDTLWEQFKENFVHWIEDDFKSEILNIRMRRLRNVLRKRDVWILKDSQMIIAKFLIRTFEEEHLTFWIEKEIVNNVETFNSDMINLLRKIDFERNLIDYSWTTAQSRFESRKSKSARQSLLRERFTQTKSLDHSLSKEKLSIRERSSISQSIRHQSSSSQSIRQRSFELIKQRSSCFQSLNKQQSSSIELHQSIEQQFNKWDSSIKLFVLKKSRRSTSLKSFIESSFRSIFAFFILSSSSSFSSFSTSRRVFTSLLRSSISSIQKKKSSIESIKSIASIKIESDHEKELANLIKFYTDETKYNDGNDFFSFKLTIFHEMCNRADVF